MLRLNLEHSLPGPRKTCRRTGVKDSHDRYANQETAYLLKRIDKFKGLAVLTSNKRGKAS